MSGLFSRFWEPSWDATGRSRFVVAYSVRPSRA